MLKLISLEIRKNKLKSILKGVLITNLAILTFMILVVFIDQSEADSSFTSYTDVSEGLFIFIKAAFIIFAAVLLGKLVIDEYKNNTITLLFMYPIPRKQLMAAKLIIVFLFTLVSIFVSYIILGAILLGINYYMNVIPGELSMTFITSQLIKILASSFYAAGISLIPLYFGMRKKSVPATIVSSVLVVSLISGGFDQFRLGNLTAVSVTLGLLGAGIAFMALRKIETEDIA